MVAKKLIKSKFKNQVDRNGVVVELEIRKYQREVFYQNLWNQDPDHLMYDMEELIGEQVQTSK